MELTNWKTLYKKESWGNKTFGIEVRVAMDREFTENDKRFSYKIGDEIEDAILREGARIDPELQKERDAEQRHFMACFPENMNIFAEPIPNQYCSRWCCEMSPWYKVTTPKGVITIGWRKRVIHLEWEPRVTGGINADTLFPNEKVYGDVDVTRYDCVIHAYGYDKAKQYLEAIFSPQTVAK